MLSRRDAAVGSCCCAHLLADSRAGSGEGLLVLACSGAFACGLKRLTLLKTAASGKDATLVAELAMVPLPGRRILLPGFCCPAVGVHVSFFDSLLSQ